MNENPDIWKVCALCRHCKKMDEGREIPELVDSEYMTFYCDQLDVMTRDDYLMAPVEEELDTEHPRVCPYWEPYPEAVEDYPEADGACPEADGACPEADNPCSEEDDGQDRDEDGEGKGKGGEEAG